MISSEVKYGTELHKTILEALLARVNMSESDMSAYHSRWQDAEKLYAAQITEKSTDSLRRSAKAGGKPQYVTIEVPYAYGMMMSAHTYLAASFLSRSPILQFASRHGEPEMNVQAVEALMDYQVQNGGHLQRQYVRLHDALKYGISIVGTYWEKEVHSVSSIEEVPIMLYGEPVQGQTKREKVTKEIVGYEGNCLFNVRPYDYLPDTRVPLIDVQKGEFAGRKVDISWNTIIKRKLDGQYINVDAVEKRLKSGNTSHREASILNQFDIPGSSSGAGSAHHTPTSLVSTLPGIELVVELIPNQWKLGSNERPEKWVFTIIDKQIIVEARPFGMYHNQFPYNVTETEVEGYSLVKRGMLQIARPLNDIMTWLFNSHFFAVRKAVNGDVIFDPSRIVASDFLNSDGTGSRIRIRPEAYGQDVRTMFTVVQGGADVTGSHLRDTQIVMELMQTILGVNDNMMGSVNPGGRKTATEVRSSTSSAVNRLRTMAEYISATGFSPLTQQMLQTTQQMYDSNKKFRIAGDSVNREQTFIDVNPELIAGFYDYVPVDGTLPVDRFAMVNMWANLFAQMRNFPQIAAEYKVGEIFAWVAQLAGLKNIKQFRINVLAPGQVPDPNGVQLGQSGPPGGTGQKPTAGGGGAAGPVIPLPRQVPGVGRAG